MAHVLAEIDESTLDLATLLRMGPMAPVANPHTIYASLRKDNPVCETTGVMPGDESRSFLITRYADVKHVLKDSQNFSSDIVQRTMGIVMGPTVVGMDGKEHLKHRTLITPSMTPRVLKGNSFHEVVRKTADEAIEMMKAAIRENPEGAKFFDKTQKTFVEGDFHAAMDINRFDFCLKLVPGDPTVMVRA